jgi:hypothetical protein
MVLSIGLVPAVVYGSRPEPGIYLDLRVYNNINGVVIEVTQSLRTQRGIATCVFVDLVEPEQAVPVASKCFEGVPIVFIPYKLLEPGLRKWWRTLNASKVPLQNIRTTEVGLIVRVRIYDALNRKEIFYGLNSLPIPLNLFEKPRALQYTLALRREIPQLVPIERKEIMFMPSNMESVIEEQSTQTGGALVAKAQSWLCQVDKLQQLLGPNWRCSCQVIALKETETHCLCSCEKVLATVKPENLTSTLSPDFFSYTENGVLVMKTPIAILYNNIKSNSSSAGVGLGVAIVRQGVAIDFKLTYGFGNIYEKISKGLAPDATVTIVGATIRGGHYGFDLVVFADAMRWGWIYIWGRPVTEFLKLYTCYWVPEISSYTCYYDKDEVRAYMAYVWLTSSEINGGAIGTKPPDSIMNNLFSGITMQFVKTLQPPSPSLDCIQLENIFRSIDTCDADVEIGIPVGAIVAVLGCMLAEPLGITCTSASATTLTAFLSGLGVDINMEGSSMFIYGSICNQGACTDSTYNVPEHVYIALSNIQYVAQGSCTYRIPIGIYVRSD